MRHPHGYPWHLEPKDTEWSHAFRQVMREWASREPHKPVDAESMINLSMSLLSWGWWNMIPNTCGPMPGSQQRLAMRVSLSGALLFLQQHLKAMGGDREMFIEPLQRLFEALGDLDRGCVDACFEHDSSKPPPKPARHEHFRRASVRAVLFLKEAGDRPGVARQTVLDAVRMTGARLGWTNMTKRTLGNWEAKYQFRLNGESDEALRLEHMRLYIRAITLEVAGRGKKNATVGASRRNALKLARSTVFRDLAGEMIAEALSCD